MPAEARPVRPAGIVVLATLAVACAIYFARELLVPIAFALLLATLLRPLVRRFEAARLPTTLGAVVVMVVGLGVTAVGILVIAQPARDWIGTAPQTLASAGQRLQQLRRPFHAIGAAAQKVEDAATGNMSGGGPGASDSAGRARRAAPAPAPPSPELPSLAVRLFGSTTSFLAAATEAVLLAFLLLASGDVFLQKLVKVLPLRGEKRAAVEIVRETQEAVGRYLTATVLINVAQGVVVAGAMWLLGLPEPALWGVMTFLLEFVPYLGGAAMVVLLTLAGLATSSSVGHALLAPGAYLLITTLQNNLVSPYAYGRHLRLNPVAVFLGVLVWFFLWGVPGAFLAVPIVAATKILADHLPPLAPLAEFLGE
jgi:predicted PurR-regulated permease PerM